MTPEQALYRISLMANTAVDTRNIDIKQENCENIKELSGKYLEIDYDTDKQ